MAGDSPQRHAFAKTGGIHRIGKQHRDGHRAETAGYGRDPAGAVRRGAETYVPDQLAAGQAIDAYVEYRRTRADPFARNEVRLADGRDDNFGALHFRAQVAGTRMAYRHRGARKQQLERHGTAYDVRGADADGPLALELDAVRLRQADDAIGRARS